ncbi:MAG: hypothetical protein BWX50_00109 [Euryarchaeota archaeon ADurb.Bin009]|nr:MAG: hypothetical protein BWX50_00109 [Euryarchaeota archaeon ADurb.Bin009]
MAVVAVFLDAVDITDPFGSAPYILVFTNVVEQEDFKITPLFVGDIVREALALCYRLEGPERGPVLNRVGDVGVIGRTLKRAVYQCDRAVKEYHGLYSQH